MTQKNQGNYLFILYKKEIIIIIIFRSLVTLINRQDEPVNVFDRSTTVSPSSVASSDVYSTNRNVQPKLFHQVLLNEAVNAGIKETSLDWPSLPKSRKNSDISLSSKTGSLNGRNYASSEMDRSIGSSTLVLPNSPSQRIYDIDSEDDMQSLKSSSIRNQKDGETFV